MKCTSKLTALVITATLVGNVPLFGDDPGVGNDSVMECDFSIPSQKFEAPAAEPNPSQESPSVPQVNEGFDWQIKYHVPTASSELAQRWEEMLDEEVTLSVEVALENLPGFIKDKTGLPVRLERRSPGFRDSNVLSTQLLFEVDAIPFSAVLAESLGSLGLKYRIDNDALTITSDMLELTRRGIGIHQWIGLDNGRIDDIQEQLQKEITVDFDQEPLQDAIAEISSMLNLSIMIDARSLDEIGMSVDDPVSMRAKQQTVSSVLKIMLRDLDLTVNFLGEILTVTTVEACEQTLLNRIYWLEGLGGTEEDPAELIEIIESTINPDTWDALGGPSTNRAIPGQRPAIIVSAAYDTHCRIKKFIQALRDSNFGPSPVATPVKIPVRKKPPASHSGGGGTF